MENLNYITVFCGSRTGNNPYFEKEACRLGSLIARKGYGLLYGGTHVGIMNLVANGALEAGGPVTGIIPAPIEERRLAHQNLTELLEVDTIEERKALLIERACAIVAFPGSYGTMDELFNALVLKQLGKIDKPIILLNLEGFYDPLLSQLDTMESRGFLMPQYKQMLSVATGVEAVFDFIDAR